MLQQLLTALIFIVFSFGFIFVWINNRQMQSAGIWGLSYFFASAAFALEVPLSTMDHVDFLTPMGDTLYLAGALMLAIGFSVRFERKIPWLALSLVFVPAWMGTSWYWFAVDDFTMRAEIISYACAAMTATGAISIYNYTKTVLDRLLFSVTMIFSVQFVITTIVALRINNEVLQAETFLSSMYIEIMQFSVAFFAVAIAALLFANLATKMIEELRLKSNTDSLTNLHNLRSFEALAQQLIEEGIRNGTPTALVLCDLDYFKNINDSFGHMAGDKVIRSFAKTLKRGRRQIDIVGRIGGEEFAILLPVANSKMAGLVAEFARSKCSESVVIDEAPTIPVTASFGVAELELGDTYRSLFSRADEMLYRAKEQGRNRVVVFDKVYPSRLKVQTRSN